MTISDADLKDIVEALRREVGSVVSYQVDVLADGRTQIFVRDDDLNKYSFEIKREDGGWVLEELE